MVARGERARRRRRVQGIVDRARAVDDRRHRVWRDAAKPREQDRARRDQEGQVGIARAQDRLRYGRERAAHAERHDGRHGRDARADRREARQHVRQHVLPGNGHPRNGNRANGTRPKDVGAQPMEPSVGRPERVRPRRFVHGVVGVPESVAHVHGAHRARGGPCGERAQTPKPVMEPRTMTTDIETINRREAVKRVTAFLGGVAFVGGSRLLHASETDVYARVALLEESGQGVGAFTAADIALLNEVADTIIPTTSTPGAKAAKVGPFMALMVTDTYDDRDQQIFRAGLKTIDEESQKTNKVGFMKATPRQRLALLERLDREQKAHMDARDAAQAKRDSDKAKKGEKFLPDKRKEVGPWPD